jgi:hypothetical protein
MSNKVTGGLPSLSPEKRNDVDTLIEGREKSRASLLRSVSCDLATTAPDGSIDTTNGQAQLGFPLTSGQLRRRLSRCNPNLIFELSKSDSTKYGIYICQNVYDPIAMQSEYKKVFLLGMESGVSPEFSVRHHEEKVVPKEDGEGWEKIKVFVKETRGWRTVLARLLRIGVINEPQIRKNFDFSRDSANWKSLTT